MDRIWPWNKTTTDVTTRIGVDTRRKLVTFEIDGHCRLDLGITTARQIAKLLMSVADEAEALLESKKLTPEREPRSGTCTARCQAPNTSARSEAYTKEEVDKRIEKLAAELSRVVKEAKRVAAPLDYVRIETTLKDNS